MLSNRRGSLPLAVFALAALLAAPAGAQNLNVQGTWDLYDSNSPSRRVAAITIDEQSGSSFSVAGTGWTGRGRVCARTAYYDWVFGSGERGRTTFTITGDGTLRGQVQGPSDKPGFNWSFIARRASGANRCVSTNNALTRRDDGYNYQRFVNNCDSGRRIWVCFESGSAYSAPFDVPPRNSVDVQVGLQSSSVAVAWLEGTSAMDCPCRR